jgi:hypothetical protein
MLGQLIIFETARRFSRFLVPFWVIDKGLLLLHPVSEGFAGRLAAQIGARSDDAIVAHCVILHRIFGLDFIDFDNLFACIRQNLDTNLSAITVEHIDGQIDHQPTDCAANAAAASWEYCPLGGQAKAAEEAHRRFLASRHTPSWPPLEAVMEYAVLVIEAARSVAEGNSAPVSCRGGGRP